MNIYITGSGGVVGGSLYKNLTCLGYVVLRVGRGIHDGGCDVTMSQLEAIPQAAEHKNILINCAYNFSDKSIGISNENYLFSERLIKIANRANFKIINISTMSAYDGCVSKYGRMKKLIEELFEKSGHVSIRLGLVDTVHKKTLLNNFRKIRDFVPFQIYISDTHGYQYISDLEMLSFDIQSISSSNEKLIIYCLPYGFTITDLLYPKFRLFKLRISIDFLIYIFNLMGKFVKLRFGADSLLGLKYSYELKRESDV